MDCADYVSGDHRDLWQHIKRCEAWTGVGSSPDVIDGVAVKYSTIVSIFSAFHVREDSHCMFTLPEIDLYSIFLKYAPASWYECRACSEYLRTVGKVMYYFDGKFTSCLRSLMSIGPEDLNALPKSIRTMINEMKDHLAAAVLPYNRGEKTATPVVSLPAPVGGPWSHMAWFGPTIGYGNCVSQGQLDEYYTIINKILVRYEKIRHLLCREGRRPGIITTDILNFTEDNVKTSAYICSMLMYVLENVDPNAVAWKYQMQLRKLMYGHVTVWLPDDEDWGRKLADYRAANFTKLTMVPKKIPFDLTCMQTLTGSAGSGGMLGCVCDIIIEKGYDNIPLTPSPINRIRDLLPLYIREAHLQHRKTAAESDLQIRNVTREIELKYGVGYLDRVPGVRHISVGQIKAHDAIFPSRTPINGFIPGPSCHKMSMTSFVSLLRRLPVGGYNLKVSVSPLVHVFALVEYDCRKILRNYPCFWYFLVDKVSHRMLGVTRGEQQVSFICARPDMSLNDNTSSWLIGIDGAQMSETGITLFENYLSSDVDRTHYRTLTTRTGSASSVIDQACGITAHADQDGSMREDTTFHLHTSNQMLYITVNTRRPDYCGNQLSVDDAFNMLYPRKDPPVVSEASATSAARIPTAADAAASSECRICMDAPKDHMLMPCNHLCVCVECASALKGSNDACPICRKPVSGYARVYDA